ncbi:Signal transduction histidine kinase [Chryseobacterium rhizoplanae]|uniref:Signal transduction histidine kinase n=1 Tax=Chryseobacterium rhizoplanae TaxID=1609531 RepID=A0A521DL32_9FLAO|nr:two-component regulator propeller domain-containing protein [Chryseobacterium rhizoplanae]SMO72433.1 Signal transduction histidine kinase [Chryseobacterium rhizoplanae]
MKNSVILILFFTICKLCAQSEVMGQNYNIDNGLPQNSVKDIIKDKYGFIWISTENGITRFDGQQFLTLDRSFNKKRYLNFFGNIEKDSIFSVEANGDFTAFITKRKLSKTKMASKFLKPVIFYNYKRYNQFNKNSVSSKLFTGIRFFIYLNKDIYFVEKDLITYYNHSTGVTKKIKIQFTMDEMRNVFIHENHIFIVKSNDRKIIKITNGELSFIDSDPLYNNPQNNIYWSQGSGQVFVINKDTIYLSEYTDGKLHLKKINHIANFNKLLRSLYINTIVYDKQNHSLFFGSLTKGLYILTIPQFSISRKKSPFADNVFYTTLPFNNRSVITPDGTIYDSISDLGTVQKGEIENYFFAYDKYSLANNTHDDIFFIKDHKLYKRLKAYQYSKSVLIPIPEYIDAVYGKDKHLYVIILKDNKYYLSQYDEELKKTHLLFSFHYAVNDLKKYDEQQLLIGGMNGLYMGNYAKKEIRKISDFSIKKIIQTTDNNIWILTKNHGFYLFRNNKLIKMPLDKKSYLLDPHTILEDKQGNFWISTNNGLFKIPKATLLQFAADRNTPVTYYQYTIADGLSINELNGGGNPIGSILPNGQMVLPSLEGLVFFKPDKIKSFYPKNSNFFIERAKLDDKEMPIVKDTLHIPNNRFTTLEIFLDFPYFKSLNNIDLDVLIDGGANWKDLGLQRKYVLENLEPGYHQLKFRYLQQNNNYTYKTIIVKVDFLFYQSQYFKILMIFIALLITVLIIKLTNNQLKVKNELLIKANLEINAQKEEINNSTVIREKLIEAISHDISTPIKHLSHLSKKLDDTDNLEIQKKYLHSIHKSSEMLYHFTLELGNYAYLFSNTVDETIPYLLNDVLEEKKSFFENIAQDNNTIIEYNQNELLYSKVNRSVISAIVHNIIDNAVKNTSQGKIILDTVDNDSFFSIKISDNGKGMSAEQLDHYNNIYKIPIEEVKLKGSGYGLKFVLLLLDKINSQINFKNNIPKGTIVEIKIPK